MVDHGLRMGMRAIAHTGRTEAGIWAERYQTYHGHVDAGGGGGQPGRRRGGLRAALQQALGALDQGIALALGVGALAAQQGAQVLLRGSMPPQALQEAPASQAVCSCGEADNLGASARQRLERTTVQAERSVPSSACGAADSGGAGLAASGCSAEDNSGSCASSAGGSSAPFWDACSTCKWTLKAGWVRDSLAQPTQRLVEEAGAGCASCSATHQWWVSSAGPLLQVGLLKPLEHGCLDPLAHGQPPRLELLQQLVLSAAPCGPAAGQPQVHPGDSPTAERAPSCSPRRRVLAGRLSWAWQLAALPQSAQVCHCWARWTLPGHPAVLRQPQTASLPTAWLQGACGLQGRQSRDRPEPQARAQGRLAGRRSGPAAAAASLPWCAGS